eukprot:TRINITY_DN35912_c0_g1_i1.p1 TRINITY_DN35912_c0_g1~~TRINITY_DN35912_c0_g1_i1.p1  ORF type:complete len:212 (+),score=-35.57 TRINITY_DN35912_c0_g1_i1:270-905(+)
MLLLFNFELHKFSTHILNNSFFILQTIQLNLKITPFQGCKFQKNTYYNQCTYIKYTLNNNTYKCILFKFYFVFKQNTKCMVCGTQYTPIMYHNMCSFISYQLTLNCVIKKGISNSPKLVRFIIMFQLCQSIPKTLKTYKTLNKINQYLQHHYQYYYIKQYSSIVTRKYMYLYIEYAQYNSLFMDAYIYMPVCMHACMQKLKPCQHIACVQP